MKKIVLAYFVLALLLGISLICLAGEEYDFRKTRWGMSKEEVKQSETREPDCEEETALGYSGEDIAGLDVHLVYHFLDDKLYCASYRIVEEHAFENKYIDDCKRLKELLVRKYGEPFIDKQIWHRNLYKNKPDRWGFAISIGEMEYLTVWEKGDTRIGLWLKGENYEIDLYIMYESKELGEEAEIEKEKENMEKL